MLRHLFCRILRYPDPAEAKLLGLLVATVIFYGFVVLLSSMHTPPKPTSGNPSMSFNVVQYNIFGRPYLVDYDGQEERFARVPVGIKLLETYANEIDVVTFTEATLDRERTTMLEHFKLFGFNYSTSILAADRPASSLANGGVLIVSKWPIQREAQHVYSGSGSCVYADCLAAKGVKYARIVKTENGLSKVFNVFASHLQAWSTPEAKRVRYAQMAQARAFIEALNIPRTEPVIFAGDFNTDLISFPEEVAHLLLVLNASMPQLMGDQKYTSDPHTNVLVGRDGAAGSDRCASEYLKSWGPSVNHTYHPSRSTEVQCHRLLEAKERENSTCGSGSGSSCTVIDVEEDLGGVKGSSVFIPWLLPQESLCYCPCCPYEWLDYVLWAREPFQQPLVPPTLEARPVKMEPFVAMWGKPILEKVVQEKMVLLDLSDHYPVVGKFRFAVDPSQPVVHLDGCSSTSDCHLRWFRCYCTGPGCFLNNTVVDGTKLDSNHPVNKNCLFSTDQCICGPT